MNNVGVAFALTLFAGLATVIGAFLALVLHRANTHYLSISLGFSAGVMIYVSMVELLPTGREALVTAYGETGGSWAAVGAFFGGILLIGIIDRMVPSEVNPHEIHHEDAETARRSRLMRTGTLTALALALHNFPEGFATFIAALQSPSIAIPIAVAIAIHNIPEGIAVAIPINYATGSPRTAYRYTLLSGLAEPLGAVIGYLALRPFLTETTFGYVFAAIGGVMTFISLDELLPAAHDFGEHHYAVYGLMGGMFVMAFSLVLLRA